ncbi:orotidine 5'-phosphate decarboxylase / HUMPS family protein [Streptomyces sp. NPDC059352]|uniref:orotidine 5'-phosphate decarboxylase / HUMPS family protein n=1 Tax=Streptomyces sp. NPDC059352 TaxID=3346810 RepID=UPI003693E4EA
MAPILLCNSVHSKIAHSGETRLTRPEVPDGLARPVPGATPLTITHRGRAVGGVGASGRRVGGAGRTGVRLARRAGCHGVIASPQEAAALRGEPGADALIVTPGVTLAGETAADHARSGTPRAAITAGASHVVVGRTVTRAADPVAAVRLVRANLVA